MSVKVSFRLLDIPAIREADNEVFIKLSLKLVWFERRATYHNLKEKVSQNTLENDDVKTIWIPKLIYENNKDNSNTHSEMHKSSIVVRREGNLTRSGLYDVDETEVFKGNENPIEMIQSYTKDFKCQFDLNFFPFDTQVRNVFF